MATVELIDSDPKGPNLLTEEEANARASVISNVKYDLNLSIKGGSPTYEAHLTTHLDFKSTGQGTFFDFIGKTIHKFEINGNDVTANKDIFKSNRLHLGADALKNGTNVLKFHYTNEFNHSGSGFHQFIDPEDKQEYLFTDFEPFEAHRLLPCFNQPNIKAKFTVEITAPSEWQVITNYPTSQSKHEDGRTIHKALETPPISTYIFAVVAGPFDSFTDKVIVRGKEIPLRLFCRKSLTKYLTPDLEGIFTITKQGFEFLTDLFDIEYPFVKYDQIFVPEYNQGAMENAGCVTFNESYLFRDPPTESQRMGRGDTILHELTHMWFGNLVSPNWWDGLWLNESFATFISYYALSLATVYKGDKPWQSFNASLKVWAEREDQLATTHPIQGKVADTEQTFLNFDGITYAKGACALKQLLGVIGEPAFKAGMNRYFKQHAWGNATITDFLKALEHGYNSVSKGTETLDLIEWSKLWLETLE